MKKIFLSKLTYLILLVIVNVIAIFSLCIITGNKLKNENEYQVSITSGDSSAETVLPYYTVRKGNLSVKDAYNPSVKEKSTLYSSFTLDSVSVSELSEVKKGDLLGKKDGSDVCSEYDSFVLTITSNEDNTYLITLYNYNQFNLLVELDSNTYLSSPFSTETNYSVTISNLSFNALFDYYDLSSFKSGGKIYAVFSLENCELLVNSDTSCTLYKVKEELNNVYYIEANAFYYRIETNYFSVQSGNELTSIPVFSTYIIDDYAVIESTYTLFEGLKLYVR